MPDTTEFENGVTPLGRSANDPLTRHPITLSTAVKR
jgi:hypothetical protein